MLETLFYNDQILNVTIIAGVTGNSELLITPAIMVSSNIWSLKNRNVGHDELLFTFHDEDLHDTSATSDNEKDEAVPSMY